MPNFTGLLGTCGKSSKRKGSRRKNGGKILPSSFSYSLPMLQTMLYVGESLNYGLSYGGKCQITLHLGILVMKTETEDTCNGYIFSALSERNEQEGLHHILQCYFCVLNRHS